MNRILIFMLLALVQAGQVLGESPIFRSTANEAFQLANSDTSRKSVFRRIDPNTVQLSAASPSTTTTTGTSPSPAAVPAPAPSTASTASSAPVSAASNAASPTLQPTLASENPNASNETLWYPIDALVIIGLISMAGLTYNIFCGSDTLDEDGNGSPTEPTASSGKVQSENTPLLSGGGKESLPLPAYTSSRPQQDNGNLSGLEMWKAKAAEGQQQPQVDEPQVSPAPFDADAEAKEVEPVIKQEPTKGDEEAAEVLETKAEEAEAVLETKAEEVAEVIETELVKKEEEEEEMKEVPKDPIESDGGIEFVGEVLAHERPVDPERVADLVDSGEIESTPAPSASSTAESEKPEPEAANETVSSSNETAIIQEEVAAVPAAPAPAEDVFAGLVEKDVDMIVKQMKCSREDAAVVLRRNNGDVTQAIMDLALNGPPSSARPKPVRRSSLLGGTARPSLLSSLGTDASGAPRSIVPQRRSSISSFARPTVAAVDPIPSSAPTSTLSASLSPAQAQDPAPEPVPEPEPQPELEADTAATDPSDEVIEETNEVSEEANEVSEEANEVSEETNEVSEEANEVSDEASGSPSAAASTAGNEGAPAKSGGDKKKKKNKKK